MGIEFSLQIFMWWIGESQRIIDLFFEEQWICGSQKTWLGKGETPATYVKKKKKWCYEVF